ncbi:MAG TPA: 2-hydroxyacyl-CoA dehydratase family protein [Thermodesulfobacteriota bacterium]|nr:2-hydroxyacyl-CoA dehydratase family protein [Thermodesulfobacteriota bacterium]
MSEKHGKTLDRVERYYGDYGVRAKELKKEGKKIIGYICSFVPLEIITAAGCIPFRVRGNVHEPITKGDTLLETIVCPYYRSCFDLSVKQKYDFLSGMVIPHGCDSMVRSYSAWSYSLPYSYFHFINIPTVCGDSSSEFFDAELDTFRKSLEKFAGKVITDHDLTETIRIYNENRNKVKALYEFRKEDPPRISGTDLTMVLTAGSSLPIGEFNTLLDQVLAEIGKRKTSPTKKGPRIFIDGACLDNIELIKLVEELGGNVVADTICNGARDYFPRTDEGGDPINALAHRYLDKVNCPKTFRENKTGTFAGDIASRFGDIGAYAMEFNVEGAILYLYKYCDPFGFEVPARKAYYKSINIPLLHLEDVYSAGTMSQLRTRIQAFLEMIG